MTSQYQQRFWSLLVETRVHVYYLSHYTSKSEWWDKAVNIFLAITSSGSIAAWAIWQEFTWVWPVLIAGSQVVSAVKPFLPYNQRRKMASALADSFQSIALQVEAAWFSVAEGRLDEEAIHKETIRLRGLLLDAERKNLDGEVLPKNEKLMQAAESDASQYFCTHYPSEV